MKVGLCRQTIQVASRVVLINDADQVLTIAVAEMLSVPPIIISGEHEKDVVVECLTLGAAGYQKWLSPIRDKLCWVKSTKP